MREGLRKNIANFITLIRLVVAIAILILYFSNSKNWFWRCIGLFALGSITDLFDGYVARKFNCVSDFGKLLDPLCDKSMMLSMLLVLALGEYIYLWIFLAVALKEVLMIIGSMFFFNKNIVVKSNWYGKLATGLLTASTIMAVCKWRPYSDYALFISVAWTFVAAIQYGILYFRQLKKLKHA